LRILIKPPPSWKNIEDNRRGLFDIDAYALSLDIPEADVIDIYRDEDVIFVLYKKRRGHGNPVRIARGILK
jgi:hypothetical protein